MKKLLCIFLSVVMVVVPVLGYEFDEQCDKDYLKGQLDGSRKDYTGTLLLSFGLSALLSPLLGGGAVIIGSYLSNPEPNLYDLEGKIPSRCYLQGYSKKARAEKASNAWAGAGLGVLLNLILLSTLTSN